MQVCRDLIEILETTDKEQLKAEYKSFMMRPRVTMSKDDNFDYGRVGKIVEINDREFMVDGKYPGSTVSP